jgi:manganese/zinc/iron transport system permease protein
MNDSLWILTVAIIASIACALTGSTLVIRRQALTADAISHAVLPGIFFAYSISGGRNSFWLLPGAAAAGWFAAFLIQGLQSKLKLPSESATGLVFTAMFALGVVLISYYARQVDLDAECLLYGEMAYIPLEQFYLGDTPIGPKALWVLTPVVLCCIITLLPFYRYWNLISFDSIQARLLGYSPVWGHQWLMALVSWVCVAAFQAVGAILVVALMVIPAQTALLYARNLKQVWIQATLWALVSAIGGWLLAELLAAAYAASIGLVSLVAFGAVFLFTMPRRNT